MANDERFFGMNKIEELTMKIKQSHLGYLVMEESPKKLQLLSKLEGLIKEYLCLVPNEIKYIFPETGDILYRSALVLPDFSGYRACTAWMAISRYAFNLLSQPWRKEYQTIRTYCGYYKHEVETRLVAPEIMFHLMGYDGDTDVMTLDLPVDPDRVIEVSRDAIVASVECQILKEIWEAVSQQYKISWLEVLQFRQSHVGTPEQAIRSLRFFIGEQRCLNKRDSFNNYPNSQAAALPYQFRSNDFNSLLLSPEEDYNSHDHGNCITGYYGHVFPESMNNTYGYISPDGVPFFPNCTAIPAYVQSISSSESAEFDSSISSSNHAKHPDHRSRYKSLECVDTDEIDAYKQDASGYFEKADTGTRKKSKSMYRLDKDSNNEWEYVYRNLENSGYSKDLGDREDILRDTNGRLLGNSSYKSLKDKEKRVVGRQEMRNSRCHYRDVELNANSHRERQNKKRPFNLLEHPEILRKMCEVNRAQFNTSTSSNIPLKSANTDSERLSEMFDDLKVSEKRECHTDKWSCRSCTFLNDSVKVICDICGKSKEKGKEDQPLASGGKECPKCTLVNHKHATSCDACATNLEHSSTYV